MNARNEIVKKIEALRESAYNDECGGLYPAAKHAQIHILEWVIKTLDNSDE